MRVLIMMGIAIALGIWMTQSCMTASDHFTKSIRDYKSQQQRALDGADIAPLPMNIAGDY